MFVSFIMSMQTAAFYINYVMIGEFTVLKIQLWNLHIYIYIHSAHIIHSIDYTKKVLATLRLIKSK